MKKNYREVHRDMKIFNKVTMLLIQLLLFLVITDTASAQKTKVDQSLRMGENRTTLDPMQFNNNQYIREAYTVAKKIPWILDSIYCFCYCKESFGHKSLLSCYVDDHASV